jgi:hypothetical protein
VTTIAPHLAVASVLTARHLSYLRPSAIAKLAAPAASRAAGGLALVAMVVIGGFLAAVAAAARGLADLFAQFVRLASAMMSALAVTVIAVLAAVALLVHH